MHINIYFLWIISYSPLIFSATNAHIIACTNSENTCTNYSHMQTHISDEHVTIVKILHSILPCGNNQEDEQIPSVKILAHHIVWLADTIKPIAIPISIYPST